MKYRIIESAAELFCMDTAQQESLANRAGLSFALGSPEENAARFHTCLCGALSAKKKGELRWLTGVLSERMFGYLRAGLLPAKESTLVLAIALGLSPEELHIWTASAGYCLSRSLPGDQIVLWYVERYGKPRNAEHLLREINERLYAFGLPLLMTREKRG